MVMECFHGRTPVYIFQYKDHWDVVHTPSLDILNLNRRMLELTCSIRLKVASHKPDCLGSSAVLIIWGMESFTVAIDRSPREKGTESGVVVKEDDLGIIRKREVQSGRLKSMLSS